MSAPYTASLIVQDVYGTNLTSPLWQVFAFLNVFMYSVAFLNPVMFFVSNPDFKRDLWHLIKCHYIKKERKVFSFENPSVSFPEESDSRPGSQLKPLPLDDFSEPVYASKPSTPTLNRVEVYAVPLENNSEVPCVKASMVPTQVGQLSKVEKERKSSPLASPFPFPNPIFENTDAQSAGSFDQGRKNPSRLSCSVVFSRGRRKRR